MKKISFILTVIIATGILSGCQNLMKYNEVAEYNDQWLYDNESEVSGMLGVVYSQVRHGLGNSGFPTWDGAMLASATDESDFAYSLSQIFRYYNGAWSSINAFEDTWKNSFSGVYTANVFLENLDKIFATLEQYKYNPPSGSRPYEQMVKIFELYPYQARFLRAYFYFELAKTYGDVPLITRTITPAEANQLTRTPVQDVFKFIVDECDAIAESLPVSYADVQGTHIGRVNRPTVLALKARTLLYAASPLFKPSNPKEAWRKAAVACKELIDNAEGWGIKLSAYSTLWNPSNFYSNPEVIWFRYAASTNYYAVINFPAGNEGALGGNCPTQNLVDAYEYSSAAPAAQQGKSFGEVNPATITAASYSNLDPRFGWTVAKNGDTWPSVDPYNKYPLETFEGGRNGPPTVNATTTGYYLKKYVNGSNRIVNPASVSHYAWVTYRLGEFYLDYAEAMFNYMDRDATAKGGGTLDMSANDAVNVLRNRSDIKMPLFTETGDAWEKRYMRERMVELAFEGHRFWDIRRWMLPDRYEKLFGDGNKFSTNIKTVRLSRDGAIVRGPEVQRGDWDNKFYFHPIPFSEMQKAQGLVQNPGW